MICQDKLEYDGELNVIPVSSLFEARGNYKHSNDGK